MVIRKSWHFKIDVTNQTVATYRLANSNNETIKEGEVDEEEVIVPGYLLTCGEYTLTVNNEETDNVYGSTFTKKITVDKVTPTMLVNYTIDGAEVNITVDIDSDATGGILFNNEYVAIANGHASYKKQFEGGYPIVNITYQTDRADVFNQVNKSISLYIANSTSTLKDTPIEVVAELAGNYVFLTAKVNETATGLVMFSINGSSVFMPIINGEAHHYDILDAGTYNVLVSYTGDSVFNGNSTVKTIVVNDPIKKNTTITPKVEIDGNNVEITVNVNENATGYVAFTIDGNTYNVELFLGEAVFKGKFDEGNHVIDVEYLGDDEFESNSTTVNFTVEKTPLKNTTVELTTRIDERTLELLMTFDEGTNGFAMIDINGTETYVKVDGGFAYY
ncbi:Ig-like domain-containing protein [uncultured Methanobrevibacter sp.]|uniref:Ig-like domain-containing protein n=1 Tax=uncultured Methanobrevibacter sp. TaxID=253161 RepID=UPI0025F59000|nr:Ig-like domain-containing protein [uncultured Methanobrevibacter sp.]